MVLARFLPRDEQFFTHFNDSARNALARRLAAGIRRRSPVIRRPRPLIAQEYPTTGR